MTPAMYVATKEANPHFMEYKEFDED